MIIIIINAEKRTNIEIQKTKNLTTVKRDRQQWFQDLFVPHFSKPEMSKYLAHRKWCF